MLRNFLKIAVRNLTKRKAHTLINIFGLAAGMAVCLLIVLFVRDETRFDRFQANGGRVYRLALERKYPGRSTSYAIIPLSLAEAVKKEFPEVQETVRLFDLTGEEGLLYLRVGDRLFEEKKVFFVDPEFFRVFTADMLEGSGADALSKPNSVVLNASTAARYFGSPSAALGKTLLLDGGASWVVTGVCRDWPEQSHFLFDLLVSSSTLDFIKQPNFVSFSAHTYLLLHPSADPKALEAKFPALLEKYVAGPAERNYGVPFKQFQAAGNGYRYFLQPLRSIHLHSNLEAELRPNGSSKIVSMFGLVALFILLLAGVNFVNLSTARSLERAKEVGVRKTFGSERGPLIAQFLTESVLTSALALVLAVGFMSLARPFVNQLTGKHLTLQMFAQPGPIALVLGLALVVGILAGLYPAFVLSSFRPIVVLRGRFTTNRMGTFLRHALVVFQFAISVVLIVSTVVVNRQVRYMLGEKVGFKKDHIILVNQADLLGPQTEAFKEQLRKLPGVETVAGASGVPGQQNFFGLTLRTQAGLEPLTGRGIVVDDQYASALDLQLVRGRFFSKAFPTDALGLVLNEKAVAEMGLKEPLGARLVSPDRFLNKRDGTPNVFTVVGVVKDFHFQSLHQKISPLVIINSSVLAPVHTLLAVRIKPDKFQDVLRSLAAKWGEFVKERPFHYDFFDRKLAELYQSEETTRKVFTAFSLLAILIACVGLLGLVTYATQQRMREISIRKVLGASVPDIVGLLSKDFLKLVLLAAAVAWPLSWLAMRQWLQEFPYRTTLSWWVFAAAGAAVLLITLLTISAQAVKAALAHPAKSLRTE